MSKALSLRKGLGTNLVLLVMVPVILFGLASVFVLNRLISRELKRDQDGMTTLIEENVRSLFESSHQSMVETMALMEQNLVPIEKIPPLLDLLLEEAPLLQSVYILDERGIVIYAPSDQRSIMGNDYSRFDFYYKLDQDTTSSWSSTFITPESSEVTFAFSFLGNENWTYVGFYSLDTLQDLILRLGQQSSHSIGILNEQRIYVAHSDFTKVSQRRQELDIDLESPETRIIYDGERVILHRKEMEGLGLTILLMETQFHYYSPLIFASLVNMTMAVFIFLVVVVYASYQSRQISMNILDMVAQSSDIIQGNYDTTAGLSNFVEINNLVRNFNQMAITIKKSIEEISQSRNELKSLNSSLKEQYGIVQRREQQLQLVMDSSYDGIIFMDRDLKIIRMSRAVKELFSLDLDAEEVRGMTCHAVLKGREKVCDDCIALISLKKEQPETRLLEENGKMVEETSTPVYEHGEIEGVIITYRDVTQRLQMEKKLNQTIKMEAIGRLAGGIAHDFNNILQVIFGYGELMQQPSTVEEMDDYLKNIIETAERAEGLVQQLMAFCRMEEKEKVPLELDPLLEGTFDMLKRLIGDQMVLVHELEAGEEKILGDKNRIEQILVNLVVNAKDAMSGKGVLTLRTYTSSMDNKYVVMELIDQGTGIPKEIQEKIFDPFFSTKDVGKGTGLGLATVFGIVESHGGLIDVESTMGVGTTFRILFPIIP